MSSRGGDSQQVQTLSYKTQSLISYKLYYMGCNVQYDKDNLFCLMLYMKVVKRESPNQQDRKFTYSWKRIQMIACLIRQYGG